MIERTDSVALVAVAVAVAAAAAIGIAAAPAAVVAAAIVQQHSAALRSPASHFACCIETSGVDSTSPGVAFPRMVVVRGQVWDAEM